MPDGSTFSQEDIEAARPIPAINPHLKASLPLTRENLAQLRLLLQQFIRQGKSVGILTGAYAAMLNELTDEELFEEVEKKRKELQDAILEEWKAEIQERIERTKEQINNKIDGLNDEINREQAKAAAAAGGAAGGVAGAASSTGGGRRARFTSGQSSDKRIKALRAQRDKLQSLDEKLDKINKNLSEKKDLDRDYLSTVDDQVDRIVEKVETTTPEPRKIRMPSFFKGKSNEPEADVG